MVFRQYVTEQVMHAGDRVADRHRAEGVTVITVAQGEEFLLAGLADRVPVLNGHFQSNFHGHRAGIAEKDPFQCRRRDVGEQLRQAHCRCMCQAAEHHVRH